MILFQFQFTETESEDELDIIPEFCVWLCGQIYSKINNKHNLKKLQVRIPYLLKVPWITWTHKKELDENNLMELIGRSLTFDQCRKGIWRIKINTNMTIPNTSTSIDRLVRFIEYGDYNTKSTAMFTNVKQYFNQPNLNKLWKLYSMDTLGYLSETKINSK